MPSNLTLAARHIRVQLRAWDSATARWYDHTSYSYGAGRRNVGRSSTTEGGAVMWLDIVDKAQLVNLDYVESIVLECAAGGQQWTLTAVTCRGTVHPIASYTDSG